MQIEKVLLDLKIIRPDDLPQLHEAIATGLRADQAVVNLGLADERTVLKAFADSLGLQLVTISEVTIDPKAIELAPARLIFKRQVLPISAKEGVLTVAVSDPFDVESLDELASLTGFQVEPVLASREEIGAEIKQRFGVGGETVGALVGKGDLVQVDERDQHGDDGDKLAEEASVVKLVNEILLESIEQRASDLHIEPIQKGLRVRYRIDGILQTQALPPEIHRFAAAIVSRIKIMAKLNIAEKRLPQDGRIQMRGRGRDIDIRVSVIPMALGEGVVLRILDKGRMTFDLQSIGMLDDQYHLWRQLIELPHGILLVTGPTGSGKTTTLYSALQEIATEDVKVITVEDPVEYHFDKIQQIQTHAKIGLTFASGLRSILRHDPDVILIGEIRDMETAESATQAALTGHLVLSTLHTNDSASAFTRLTDMGVEPYLVASTVEAVLAQRLVRLLCADCKEPYEPTLVDLPPDFPDAEEPGLTLYRNKGCRNCRHTGYRGRQGLFELLVVSDEVRELAVNRASSVKIKNQGLSEGMITLRQDGWRKLRMGRTTIEEVCRMTKSDELLRMTPASDAETAELAEY